MKKTQKKFAAKIIFACFASFFCFLINNAFAAGLEVSYPVISGQTLTEETKLPEFVFYLFNAGIFLGYFSVFISLIIAGVMYFLSPVSAELRAASKDRIYGAMSGLLILTLLYLIVTTINPQLSFFHTQPIQPVETPPEETKPPGVYFNLSPGCPDVNIQPHTSSVADLESLKNKVNSVDIVQDSENNTYYVSILYENVNFWGKCQYLDPNIGCHQVDQFTNSSSVYKYNFTPNGDGVYFYRKSYFNEKGGYYKVPNSKIKGIYIEKLENLHFIGVPIEEQICVKYNSNGDCASKTPPNLGGENISSVKINGDYLVLFVYFGPQDNPSGIWTSCQEFPTIDDVNKLGPQQIKWKSIRNNGGVIPNYVVIIPMQRN